MGVRKKVSTTIYLEPWQHVALQGITDQTGVPWSALVRNAVTRMLAERGITEETTRSAGAREPPAEFEEGAE